MGHDDKLVSELEAIALRFTAPLANFFATCDSVVRVSVQAAIKLPKE